MRVLKKISQTIIVTFKGKFSINHLYLVVCAGDVGLDGEGGGEGERRDEVAGKGLERNPVSTLSGCSCTGEL